MDLDFLHNLQAVNPTFLCFSYSHTLNNDFYTLEPSCVQQIVNIYILPGTILDIGDIAENKVEVILALWNLRSIWERQQQTDQLCSVLDGDTCWEKNKSGIRIKEASECYGFF